MFIRVIRGLKGTRAAGGGIVCVAQLEVRLAKARTVVTYWFAVERQAIVFRRDATAETFTFTGTGLPPRSSHFL